MRLTLKDLLTAPRFNDPEKTQAASLSYPILLATLFLVLLYAITTPVNPTEPLTHIIITAGISLLCLSMLVLLRRGHVALVNPITVSGFWLLITFSLYRSGGATSPASSVYLLIILIAGFLMGKRALIFWSFLSVLAQVFFYLGSRFGFIPQPGRVYLEENHFAAETALLIAATVVFFLAITRVQRASRRARSELHEREKAEQRLRMAMELSPVAIVLTSMNGDPFFINQRFKKVFGYALEDIDTSEKWFQTVYPDPELRAQIAARWAEDVNFLHANPQETLKAEFPIVDKWGRTHIVDFNLAVMQGQMMIVCNDVTEQRANENRTREKEIRYRSLFEAAQDGILLMDGERFVECNQAAIDIFQYPREVIVGATPMRFSPEKQADGRYSDTAARAYVQAAMDGYPQTFSWQHTNHAGKVLETQVRLSRVSLPQGDHVLAIVRDVSNQKRDQLLLEQNMERMSELHNFDLVLTTSFDLQVIFSVFLDMVTSQLAVDAANLLTLDPIRQSLVHAAGRGFRTRLHESANIPMGTSLAGKTAISREPLSVSNLQEQELTPTFTEFVRLEGFEHYYGIPLLVKGEVKGVLEIYQRSDLPTAVEWRSYLENLAGRAAVAIDNATLFADLQRANLEMQMAYETTLEGWAYMLSQRDNETETHTQRVVELTEMLARRLGTPDREIVHLKRGALLHDIGKISVPDSILNKPGPLNDVEWQIMRRHPQAAFDAIIRIDYLRPALDIPYAHHERWDGSGYPRGLKGEEIPFAARLFAVIDVWDALTSDRPYRSAWSTAETIAYLREKSGILFDPQVVSAFLDMISEDPHLAQKSETEDVLAD